MTTVANRLWPAGTLRVPRGTCPGCAGVSHPGRSCLGLATEQLYPILRKLPGAVYVPLEQRDPR